MIDHDQPFKFEGDEWHCSFALGINEVRLFHELLTYFLETWPGSPARPAVEQEFAKFMKAQMFAMKAEYMYERGS